MNSNIEKLTSCILCNSNAIEPCCDIADLYLCNDCELIFDNPRPSQTLISDYYSKNDKYEHWLVNIEARNRLWKNRLKHVLKYRTNGRLLDVGAGIGQFLNLAKKYFEVSGTEISSSAVEIAKSRYGLDLIKNELEKVEFEQKFDVITLFHVFEHVPYPYFVYTNLKQIKHYLFSLSSLLLNKVTGKNVCDTQLFVFKLSK